VDCFLFIVWQKPDEGFYKKEKQFSFVSIALPSKSPENGFYVDGGLATVFKTDKKDSTLRLSNLIYSVFILNFINTE
jgi:hypothetical protein